MHVPPVLFILYSLAGRGLLFPSRKKKVCPSLAIAQPMRCCHLPANEKLLHFNPGVSSSGLEFYSKQLIQPLSPPTFLYKRTLLSFVVETYLWFAIVYMSQIEIPLLFLNKLFMLVKYLAVFIF